jgi:hypothetical protein
VADVSFSPSASLVAAAFDQTPLCVLVLNALSGLTSNSYVDSSTTSTAGLVNSGSLLFDTATIYVALTSATSLWQVISLPLATAPITSNFNVMAGIASGQANTVVFGSSTSILYVGGMITIGSNSYTTLTELSSSGSLTWHYGGTLSPSLRLRRLYYQSPGQNIYGCADNSASNMIAITYIPIGGPGSSGPTGGVRIVSYTDNTNGNL